MTSSAFDGVLHRLARAIDGGDGDAGAWITLDEDIRTLLRRGGDVPATPAWSSGDATQPPTTPELALALCGPDGRIREASLRYVSRSPALLPLVVIRCSDWAAPVRERARAVLREELSGVTPEALGVLVAVALRTGERLRGDSAREALTRALREGPASGVTALLGSGDRAVRRLAHRIAFDRGLLSPTRLAEIAARDPDVIVQDLCATAALAAAGDPPDPAVLAPLLSARQGRVRAAGVTGLRRAGRAGEAEPFLYDRSALVRACARYVLRQAGTEPLPLYRAACAAQPGAADAVPPYAPLGLAECGERAVDVPALWELIGHERPEVRAGAVAGLRLLDAVHLQRLVPLLDDSSPRVVRETAKALRPWADHTPVDAVPARPVAVPAPPITPPLPADESRALSARAWLLRIVGLARRPDRARRGGS